MDHTINTKDLDHELVRQEITLKIAKMNHIELGNFCINNGIAFAKVQKEKLDMRGTCAVNAGLELHRQFMVARTPEELEPIPFPNIYDGMVDLEAVSDDAQDILQSQAQAERNKALGI